ncbi:ABC transporter permease [Jidongwangia harbinensis]|uniref:ABC transporter permease n=1 Tax=Jidongwangia harbinensis TaxID=2878561 RepID=UPI001CDA50F0|nr:FtsX-like permease family protein [Jidongwangia harbinensis]MCA2212076.1 FtsX-like permease family protein [Jidongwangia harbinensis]
MNTVLRTQLSGVARRPTRLLLTGLAVLVASFVVFTAVLAQQIIERSVLNGLSGTPEAVDLVVQNGAVGTGELKKIGKLPGVAEAVGRVSVGATVGGQYLDLSSDPGSGPLAQATVLSGRYPSAPGEVAVSTRTAERMGLLVGTKFSMITRWSDDGKAEKPVRATVTGLVDTGEDYGSSAYAPQATVSALVGEGALSRIDVRLAAGAAPDEVRSAVTTILSAVPVSPVSGERATVDSGAEVRRQEAEAAVSDINDVFAMVAMFVAIAVVAAGLVATSTFRIVFAQRMRQLALLRAVGAGRGAITRSLAVEGALTGLVAGGVGVLVALAVGHAVPPIARASGAELASPGLPVVAALAVVALAVLITVFAVLAPAVSAARVAPLEALRSSSTAGGRRDIGVLRWITGLLFVAGAAGLGAVVVSSLPEPDAENYDPLPMLFAVVGSAGLAFFALIALGPVLVRPILWLVGWPLRRLGPVGRLAVGGVGGAPRRAAAVSVVVALGVSLIAGVLVSGASVRVLAEREMASAVPADFELAASAEARLGTAMVEQARARAELAHVTPYRRLSELTVGDSTIPQDANDLTMSALPALAKLDVTAGSWRDIGPGTVVLSGFTADDTGLRVGDRTEVRAGARKVSVTVVGVLPDSAPLNSGLVLNAADLTRLGATGNRYSGLLADAAQGGEQGRNEGQKALQQVTGGQTGLGVVVLADQRDEFDQVLTVVLLIAVGLISLTVLIAVVGVGTTTALSVVERVRESGLLRAVGLSRGGLRAMLTAESSLYGVVGATLGLLLGVPYAWLSIKALGVNAPLALPVWQLAAVFAALVTFTALAGVLPARRAARVSPVAALGTDT